jgi:SLT domain-containing protein
MADLADSRRIIGEDGERGLAPVDPSVPRVNPIGGVEVALAKGGIVTSPTMALIGEAGPEAVIPLSRGGGFGGGITITVNNAGSVIAEADLVSSIRNALLQAQNNGQVITKSAVAI